MSDRIIVCGGGIGGLTAAIALKQFGANVVVHEREAEFKPVGAGITIQANAHAILTALGVSIPPEDSVPLGSFQMVNSKQRVLMRGDPKNMDVATPSINIHRADLHRALESSAQNLNIPIVLGSEVVAAVTDSGSVQVDFAGGSRHCGDIVVGADGAHSRIRSEVLGENALAKRSSGQMCWRFSITAPDLQPRETTEHWIPGRRAGVIPLARGRLYLYMVMSDWWQPTVSRSATPTFLREHFAGISDGLTQILQRLESDIVIHMDQLVEHRDVHFGIGRRLLIGDAAHAMTPNMGQGAGMAIEDAAMLALICQQGQTSPDLLAEELSVRRMTRVNQLKQKSWRIGQIAHARNPVLRSVRDFIFQAMPTALTERQALAIWSPGIELGRQLAAKLEKA